METLPALLTTGDPSATAIVAPKSEPVRFAELRTVVDRLAGQLRSAGIARGHRVAIVLPNGPEMAITFLAVSSCATAAPLNPKYRTDEFRFYLADVNARALITRPGDAKEAHGAAPRETLRLGLEGDPHSLRLHDGNGSPAVTKPDMARPDDVALVLHTSGTTSRPKIVPLTQRNLARSTGNIVATLSLNTSDRCLNVMPLFHIHGLVAALLSSLAAGGSVVCSPGFDAFRFFDWVDEFAPTWYTAVPTMHQAILSRAHHHTDVIERARLRFVRSSSASLPTVILQEIERVFGVPMVEAYGMTEASHQIASNPLPPGRAKPQSVGRATGIETAVMDENGHFVPVGQRGEVVIKGETVLSGYDNNAEANAQAFTGGWFRTGDEGYLDEEGYLFLTGRLKEIINRGGEKISPLEIDNILLQHSAVEQAVTFGRPHDKLGEDVAAAVVLTAGATTSEQELRAFVAKYLANFKVPRTVVLVDEIPKGPTGKLQRIGLAERLGLT